VGINSISHIIKCYKNTSYSTVPCALTFLEMTDANKHKKLDFEHGIAGVTASQIHLKH
jgi:hypothetical protein